MLEAGGEAHKLRILFFRSDEFDEVAVGVVEDGDEVTTSEIGGSFPEELHFGCFELLDGFIHVGDEEGEVGNADRRVDEFLVLHFPWSAGE